MRGRILLVLLLLLAGGLVWRFALYPPASAQSEQKTVRVRLGEIVVKVSAPGQLMPQHQTTLYTKTGGLVRETLVKAGQTVQPGQLLLRLDSSALQGQIAVQEAQVAALQASLGASASPEVGLAQEAIAQAQVALDQARIQLSRAQGDYRLGAVPRQQLDQAQSAFQQASLNLQAARLRLAQVEQTRQGSRAQLGAAQAQLKALKGQLAASEVRSPIAGTLTDLAVAPGQAVAADAALATVSDLKSWVVQSRVAENDLPGLRLGMPVKVAVDALQLDQGLSGKVVTIGQTKKFKDPVYYYQVDSLLQVGDAQPTPGLSATADFITQSLKNVPILPLNTLQTVQGKTVVEVLEAGKTRPVEVKTGLDDGTNVAISSGLKPGEVVILPGAPGGAPSAPGGLGKAFGF